MSKPVSLIHISDLHFHRFPRTAREWLSKRALGWVNLALRRARHFPPERAARLVAQLDGMAWDHLVITGDLTQLGLESEFELAWRVLQPLLERGPEKVTVLPGNHDRYVTPLPGEQGFDAYFGGFFGEGEIGTRRLSEKWAMVAWDSVSPQGWFSAAGRVTPATLEASSRWLEGLSPGTRVIVANHYPLWFDPPDRYRPHHELADLETTRQWVASHGIDLYLHGHLHRNWVVRTGEQEHPCSHVNSASSTQTAPPGASAFHRIELSGSGYRVFPLPLDGAMPD